MLNSCLFDYVIHNWRQSLLVACCRYRETLYHCAADAHHRRCIHRAGRLAAQRGVSRYKRSSATATSSAQRESRLQYQRSSTLSVGRFHWHSVNSLATFKALKEQQCFNFVRFCLILIEWERVSFYFKKHNYIVAFLQYYLKLYFVRVLLQHCSTILHFFGKNKQQNKQNKNIKLNNFILVCLLILLDQLVIL